MILLDAFTYFKYDLQCSIKSKLKLLPNCIDAYMRQRSLCAVTYAMMENLQITRRKLSLHYRNTSANIDYIFMKQTYARR